MRRVLRAATRGALAGGIAMVVMDLLWYARYKKDGGSRDFAAWEFASDVDSWDRAPAPAQVGHLVAKQLTGKDLEACAWAAPLNAVVHWATGMGWGMVYGLLQLVADPDPIPFTTVVWILPYIALVPPGIYKPIWSYDVETIAKDYTAHIVYGTSLALAYRAFD